MGAICFSRDICPLMTVFTRKELQSQLIPLKTPLNKRQVIFSPPDLEGQSKDKIPQTFHHL